MVGVATGSGAMVPAPESSVQAAMLRMSKPHVRENTTGLEYLRRIFLYLLYPKSSGCTMSKYTPRTPTITMNRNTTTATGTSLRMSGCLPVTFW